MNEFAALPWHALPGAPAPGTEVVALDDMPDGGGRMFNFALNGGGPGEEFRLLLLRSAERCYGYVNRCPHFGMPLAARDDQLLITPHEAVKCNIHYARFRWADGYCESGDCVGESLQAVPLEVVDGKVQIGAAA